MTVIDVKLPKSSTRGLNDWGALVVEVAVLVLAVVVVEAAEQVSEVEVEETV